MALPSESEARTLTTGLLASSPTASACSGRPSRIARCSEVLVKMPSPPGMPLTSTLVVRCAWNSSTTETMSRLASTVCAGRR